MTMKSCAEEGVFYGSTTMGEKGQIVIPAEARKALGLKKGEKLLVFGVHGNIVALAPIGELQNILKKLSKKTEKIQSIIQSTI